MKIPQLKKKLEVKKYHDYEIKDEYSWIHQDNILEVLKDSSKLNPEVRNPKISTARIPKVTFETKTFRLLLVFLLLGRFLGDIEKGEIPIADR